MASSTKPSYEPFTSQRPRPPCTPIDSPGLTHRKASGDEELANRAARRVRVQVAEDGSVTITAKLPATDGAVVLQALREAAGSPAGRVVVGAPAGDAAAHPDGSAQAGQGDGTCQASLADALVEVAGAYLSRKIATAGNPDIYHVIVHVGPEALSSGPASGDPAAGPGVRAEDGPDGSPAQHRVPAETRADESRAREHRVSAETSDDGPADLVTDPAHRSAGHPAHPRRCHLDDLAA
jgi:hypothetical protein